MGHLVNPTGFRVGKSLSYIFPYSAENLSVFSNIRIFLVAEYFKQLFVKFLNKIVFSHAVFFSRKFLFYIYVPDMLFLKKKRFFFLFKRIRFFRKFKNKKRFFTCGCLSF